jgi:hypothetical protein
LAKDVIAQEDQNIISSFEGMNKSSHKGISQVECMQKL